MHWPCQTAVYAESRPHPAFSLSLSLSLSTTVKFQFMHSLLLVILCTLHLSIRVLSFNITLNLCEYSVANFDLNTCSVTNLCADSSMHRYRSPSLSTAACPGAKSTGSWFTPSGASYACSTSQRYATCWYCSMWTKWCRLYSPLYLVLQHCQRRRYDGQENISKQQWYCICDLFKILAPPKLLSTIGCIF